MAEKTGAGVADKQVQKFQKLESEDKLASLKQYRSKNGLCFKCGGKWSPNHSCPEQIPLHVLKELWDALEIQVSEETSDVQSETLTAKDSVCALQFLDSNKGSRKNTLKLLARIGKHQVLVLIDSRRVGTFVSDRLVQAWALQTKPCQSTTFKVTDGGQLPCSERVPALQWCVQGHKFISDARVALL